MKKGLFLLCVVSAASIFTGCGTSEEIKQSETTEIAESSDPVQFGTDTEDEAYQFPYTALDYVTPGKYTGLTVDDISVAEVADGDIQTEINRRIEKAELYTKEKQTAVKTGVTVNVTIKTGLDGNGEATTKDIRIGSGTYSDNFEQQLLGHKPGEVVSVSDSGKEYSVTINYIKVIPDLTNSLVAELSDQKYQTVAEYRDYVKKELEEEAQEKWDDAVFMEILYEAADTSSFHGVPGDDEEELSDEEMEKEAAMYGMDLESYKKVKEDNANEEDEEMDPQTMLEVLIQGIAEKENIQVYDTDIDEVLRKYRESGYGSNAEILDDIVKEDLARIALSNKVESFLLENNETE